MPSEFEEGLMVGLLIGEGHFGGDGRQPQVTLRMHVRHETLMRWVERAFPGGRVYGPYNHDGRHYLQWMARGSFLRYHLVPLLERCLSPLVDEHSWSRFERMRRTYVKQLGPPPGGVNRFSRPAISSERQAAGHPDPLEGAAKGADTSGSRRPPDTDAVDEIFERLRRASEGTPWEHPR